jgi:hypothetical protein
MSKYFKNIYIFQKYLKIPNKRFSFDLWSCVPMTCLIVQP